MGDDFTMADCSAAPALYYANLVMPFADSHKNVTRYFERLLARPSFARAVKKADPYRKLFPRLERDYLSLNREIAASFLHLSHRDRSARFGAPGEEL